MQRIDAPDLPLDQPQENVKRQTSGFICNIPNRKKSAFKLGNMPAVPAQSMVEEVEVPQENIEVKRPKGFSCNLPRPTIHSFMSPRRNRSLDPSQLTMNITRRAK